MLRVLVLSTSGFFSLEAGRKLGKRHLHTLLDALGRDCLQGASDIAEKVSETFVSRRGPEGCSASCPYRAPLDWSGAVLPFSVQLPQASTCSRALKNVAKVVFWS